MDLDRTLPSPTYLPSTRSAACPVRCIADGAGVATDTRDLVADVVVVGAGPGERSRRLCWLLSVGPCLWTEARRIGRQALTVSAESFPASAWRLLRDMGLWEDFQRQGHLPCHFRQSHWAHPEPSVADSLRDPDGRGWLLDRVQFDAWLRDWARHAAPPWSRPPEPRPWRWQGRGGDSPWCAGTAYLRSSPAGLSTPAAVLRPWRGC